MFLTHAAVELELRSELAVNTTLYVVSGSGYWHVTEWLQMRKQLVISQELSELVEGTTESAVGVPPASFTWFGCAFVSSFSNKVAVTFMPGFQLLLPTNCLL